MQAIRSIMRVQRAAVATVAARRTAAVLPVRSFTMTHMRWAATPVKGAEDAAPANWPAGVPRRVDEFGVGWVDYRPDNIRSMNAVRNEDGDLVGRFEGEDVIFPDLEPTLEWVLSTPVDMHLFEEAPILKCYEEEELDHPEMASASNTSRTA